MPALKDVLSFNNRTARAAKRIKLGAILSALLLASIGPTSAQTQDSAPLPIEGPSQSPTAQTPAAQTPIAPSPSAQAQDVQAPPVAPQAQSAAEPGTTAPQGDNNSAIEIMDPQNRSDIPHDLSPWGMFMAADWVVKGVMIGLAIASVATWTVLVAKTLELLGARHRANSTLRIVRHAKTLAEATGSIENKGGPGAMMVRMAAHEMALSEGVVDHTDGGGIKERVTSVLNRIEVHAGRRMARGTGILATIGSISPFVGLFGTVWGIMNSFISISESQTTNLAIVAPGIAEALLATAIGLVAAIPAVVFYNVFARQITGYRHLLADVASGVERLVSRDLDFRRVPPGAAKANVTLVGR